MSVQSSEQRFSGASSATTGSRTDSAHTATFVQRHAYSLLAAVLVVGMVGQSINQIWASPDFWVHLAAVREFANSLFHPANPLVVGTAHDPYMSPYTFALGTIVKVTGLDAVTVLTFAGLANLVLLLFAIRQFVKSVSTAEYAPVLSLLFILTAWGLNPWRWSGFFDLNSIGLVLPLSSTFATGLGLLTIVALGRWLRGGSVSQLGLVGAGGLLVVLCHPLTAMWVGLVGLGFVISETRADNVRRVLALGAVILGASALASGWPFYSLARTLARSQAFDSSNVALYQSVAQRTVLALPGFFVLGQRFVRRRRDPLALGAAFNLAVYIAGYAFGHDSFGRVLSGIMIMAQVALGIYVAELILRWRTLAITTRRITTIAVVAIVVLGMIGSAKAAIRVVPHSLLPARYAHDPRLASLVSPFAPLSGLISRNDVVVASPSIALAVAASSGKVISPTAPAPFVSDIARRRAAVHALLSPQTSQDQFRSLIREYRVGWFVVKPSDAQRLLPRIHDHDLRLVHSTTQLRVYRVDENRAHLADILQTRDWYPEVRQHGRG